MYQLTTLSLSGGVFHVKVMVVGVIKTAVKLLIGYTLCDTKQLD